LSKFWQYIAPGGGWFWLINILLVVYSLGVQYWDDHGFPAKKFLEADAALATSAIMGLLLVFRTNSAYDRWWEARKIWGSLVNDLRNLCVKTREYASLTDAECKEYGQLIVGFAYGLKDHLRGKETIAYLPPDCRDEKRDCTHLPLAISQMIYRNIHNWNKSGRITDVEVLQLDRHARALMDICGGCERIKKSPITGSYKWLLWSILGLYFLILPWLLVPTIDNYSVIMVGIGAYFVTALEFLAEEVEEPFGTQANDLPLDEICKTIENSVADVLNYRGNPADVAASTREALTESITEPLTEWPAIT
jgi:putative membrane protein